MLPQTAVLSDLQGSYVFVVTADKVVERRAVRIADTTTAGVVIGDGLKGDEQVISLAGGFLRDGERVDIAPPAGATLMIRNISAWAIRNPVPPIVLFVVLFFIGVSRSSACRSTSIPTSPFRSYRSPSRSRARRRRKSRRRSSRRSKASVASVGNVKNITSAALEGQAFVYIEFQIGTPVDRAVTDVRDAVSKVRSDLPEGIEEPLVQRIDVEGGAIAYFAVGTTGMTRRGAQLVRRQHHHQAARWRSPAWRRFSVVAASIARSASSSIPRACRRSASRPSR